MIVNNIFDQDEPVFIISVAARILGVRTQTLRYYERLGLIEPVRTKGNQRVFSNRDIERVRRIRNYMDDLGVNLAGVDVILKLTHQLNHTEEQNRHLRTEVDRLRQELASKR
ncbi:MAG: MerR family transcriptional regulator [Chloroflexi bacterium]|nr:MerR family transcriptional regulator [Chloroflexota bacterium]